MSNYEKQFIQWFGGIAGMLISAMIIGLVVFWQLSIKADVRHDEQIISIKQTHKTDNLRIEKALETIQTDIKEILGRTK